MQTRSLSFPSTFASLCFAAKFSGRLVQRSSSTLSSWTQCHSQFGDLVLIDGNPLPLHFLFSHSALDGPKCTVGCILRPFLPDGISEQLPGGVFCHEPSNNHHRFVSQVNNTTDFLSLRLRRVKHPTLLFNINVASFNNQRFPGPTPPSDMLTATMLYSSRLSITHCNALSTLRVGTPTLDEPDYKYAYL